MKSLIGQTLGHYQITHRLGTGATGEVYRATDLRLRRDVAIKVLDDDFCSDPQRLYWLEREAQAASSLNHPNIVTIHDIGIEDSIPYIAMELVNGPTLRQLLLNGTPKLERLLDIGTQIADGLANAHEAGIVHRDLKPENLMLTEGGLVKILDFGLAKVGSTEWSGTAKTPSSNTTSGRLLGTTGYMSPEQVAGRPVDRRSDQFALGIILYEMATGTRPFERPTPAQTLAAIVEAEPEPIEKFSTEIPHDLTVQISKCLSKNPAQRYESTRELHRRLEGIRSGSVHTAIKETGHVVGVLPFADISAGSKHRFFSEGITEEIRSKLSQMSSVKLLSRYAIAKHDGRSLQMVNGGRPDNIIEGSVRFGPRCIRVVATLIDVRTELTVWSAQYDRRPDDILAVQTDVALQIVEALRPVFLPRPRVCDSGVAASDQFSPLGES